MTDQLSLDQLLEAQPYVGESYDIDADVRLQDALELTDDELKGLDEKEREEQAQDWVGDGRAQDSLADAIEWNLRDGRFRHATAVVDFEIDSVEFEAVEDDMIHLNVELHETADGFDERLKAEARAQGRQDILDHLAVAEVDRQALQDQIRDQPAQFVEQLVARAAADHREALSGLTVDEDFSVWIQEVGSAATTVVNALDDEYERVGIRYQRPLLCDRSTGVWSATIYRVDDDVAAAEAALFPSAATMQEAHQALLGLAQESADV